MTMATLVKENNHIVYVLLSVPVALTKYHILGGEDFKTADLFC